MSREATSVDSLPQALHSLSILSIADSLGQVAEDRGLDPVDHALFGARWRCAAPEPGPPALGVQVVSILK